MEADYIVVGSGAGGGPLAANLARAGYEVLLLEAGGDLCATPGGQMMYEVPIFAGLCTEYKDCAWDYYVHHYSDPVQEQRDSKYDPEHKGVWYPRAGTLGGCTAHNAMITVTPQAIDWDMIARLTGDWSWRAEKMFAYYARLENCRYVARPWTFGYLFHGLLWSFIALVKGFSDWRDWRHGHGFKGWLSTGQTNPLLLLKDRVLTNLVFSAVGLVTEKRIGSLFSRAITKFDPNDLRNSEDSPEGLAFTPLSVAGGKRNGPREFIRATEASCDGRLKVQLHTLATRVIFDEAKRAVGVEALRGQGLYQADPSYRPGAPAETVVLRARKEVILAAGAFNTPQILKLSGIGPKGELARHGIDLLVDLPGVGEHLQDRYEIGVVSKFPHTFELLAGAAFKPPEPGHADPFYDQWKKGQGLYTSNGSLIGVMKRSKPDIPEPDLYIFGLPAFFEGYRKGWSAALEHYRDRFTWAILKAYTNNACGRVTLQSKDPTQPPRVDFHYFNEGGDERGDDLAALVSAVEFVREMNARLGAEAEAELLPGPDRHGEALAAFIRDEAWGHHASCTAAIGAVSNPMSVLDSAFRVRGVSGLRVVDASVFPRIPGYFIASSIYMISEKAFDVIRADAQAGGPPHRPPEPQRPPA